MKHIFNAIMIIVIVIKSNNFKISIFLNFRTRTLYYDCAKIRDRQIVHFGNFKWMFEFPNICSLIYVLPEPKHLCSFKIKIKLPRKNHDKYTHMHLWIHDAGTPFHLEIYIKRWERYLVRVYDLSWCVMPLVHQVCNFFSYASFV